MASQTTEHLDTDDQRAFRLKAREWMKGRLPPRRAGEPFMDWENKALIETDRRTQRCLWDGGLAGITLPRAYGGLGLDKRYEDVFYEEAEPYRLAWHLGNNDNIILPTFLAHASEALKLHYIPKMLRGEHIWCQMTSEPSGGSDLFGLLTRAEQRGDKWVLNGSKVWTTGGKDSDMGLCLARTDPTVPKHAGLTMFLVDMKAPGMSITPLTLIQGTKDFCQEFLDDVEVPEDHIVGEVNGGWSVASTQLAAERAAVGRGWYLGVKGAAPREHIELSQEYVDLARELGLANDPFARQLVGEVLVIDAVRELTTRRVAEGVRKGGLRPTAGAIPGLISALNHAQRTALVSALTDTSGIAGPLDAGDPQAGMERVTMHRIGGGTLEMQRNNVAERHLGLPREPSFDKDVPFNQLRQNTVPGSGTPVL
jgi:alkylation response protein AidB-like acyl-CoA dehydrogenase